MFEPGEVKKTISFETHNDDAVGPAEEFIVRLTPKPGVLLGPLTEAVVTVMDDDGKSLGYTHTVYYYLYTVYHSDVKIGFTGLSGQLPDLFCEVAILEGRLHRGFSVEVSLDIGYLGRGEIHAKQTSQKSKLKRGL